MANYMERKGWQGRQGQEDLPTNGVATREKQRKGVTLAPSNTDRERKYPSRMAERNSGNRESTQEDSDDTLLQELAFSEC